MAEHSEESLQQRFIACEQTMDALENGTMSTKDIQARFRLQLSLLILLNLVLNELYFCIKFLHKQLARCCTHMSYELNETQCC